MRAQDGGGMGWEGVEEVFGAERGWQRRGWWDEDGQLRERVGRSDEELSGHDGVVVEWDGGEESACVQRARRPC